MPVRFERYANGSTLTAGWHWQTRGINAFADINNSLMVTKKINPGLDQLARRKSAAKSAFALINRGNNP